MNYNQQTPPPYYGGGNDYNSYHNTQSQAVQTASSVMKRVYSKMTLGLLVTAFISLFCASSHGYMNFMPSNGTPLARIFLIYTMTSIAKTFFICAGTFGAMSVYGYFTTKDRTKWGNFLLYALFGLIIASLVNLFTKSTQLDWIISIAGVLIFVGLTAWDTQKIKQMALTTPPAYIGHLATIGALSLYLDFINLFLYLLRFFGSQRD